MPTTVALSPTASAIAKVLVAHVQNLPPKRPILTYTQVRDRSGRSFAMIGIGKYLSEIVDKLHAADLPHGLTLFVGPVNGSIPYSNGPSWHGINSVNAPEHRRAVAAFDWSKVEFVEH